MKKGTALVDQIRIVLILALPWYQVWKLQMPFGRKMAVCGIFMLGGFTVAAGIIRIVYLFPVSNGSAKGVGGPTSRWNGAEIPSVLLTSFVQMSLPPHFTGS